MNTDYILPEWLELIDVEGRSHVVRPLTLQQLIGLRRVLDRAAEKEEKQLAAELAALVSPGLPPGTGDVIAQWPLRPLSGLILFLTGTGGKTAPSRNGAVVDPYFAAALVMKQFGAYRLAELLAMAAPEFFLLYRLACAVQADEALVVSGQGTAAALNHKLSVLAERRRELIAPSHPPAAPPLSAAEIAEAKEFAAELYRRSSTRPGAALCGIGDFTAAL